MKVQPTRRLLSATETAGYLGISVRTLYNMTSRKAKQKLPIKAKRIGKLLKFDLSELEAYVDSL